MHFCLNCKDNNGMLSREYAECQRKMNMNYFLIIPPILTRENCMNIETTQNGDQVRIVLQGIVDEKGAEELKKQVVQLNLDSVREVVIDCREVRHIGSSGIGKMLLIYKKLASRGGGFSVVNLPPPMFELFNELKLNTLFSVTQAA